MAPARPVRAAPRFETVLIHSTIMEDLRKWLQSHGILLQHVNDIREGPARVLTLTPQGARTIQSEPDGHVDPN